MPIPSFIQFAGYDSIRYVNISRLVIECGRVSLRKYEHSAECPPWYQCKDCQFYCPISEFAQQPDDRHDRAEKRWMLFWVDMTL